jgi:TolB-like protein
MATGGVNLASSARKAVDRGIAPFANISGDPKHEYFRDGLIDFCMMDCVKSSASRSPARPVRKRK